VHACEPVLQNRKLVDLAELLEEGLEVLLIQVAVGKGEGESTDRELPRGLRGCILQAWRERVFSSRSRFQRVKFYHAARSGWELLLGTKRDTDQNQLGQVTSLSLMSVDVF